MKKKVLGVIFALIIVLGLAGCKNNKESYKINEWYSFAQTYKMLNSDEDIIEYTEENVTNGEIDGGGVQLEINVTGKKAGTATLTFDVYREDTNMVQSRVYYFSVSEDLVVTMAKVDNNVRIEATLAAGKKNNIKVSDASVVSVLEKNANATDAYEYIVTALKPGDVSVTIETVDIESNEVENSKEYRFTVGEDLNLTYYFD